MEIQSNQEPNKVTLRYQYNIRRVMLNGTILERGKEVVVDEKDW